MSWYEFNCAVHGLAELRKHDFNVMRHGASLSMLPHVDRKHRNSIRPEKLFPFADEKPESEQISEAEAIKWMEFFSRELINIEEV
jgi:hypothetical protein